MWTTADGHSSWPGGKSGGSQASGQKAWSLLASTTFLPLSTITAYSRNACFETFCGGGGRRGKSEWRFLVTAIYGFCGRSRIIYILQIVMDGAELQWRAGRREGPPVCTLIAALLLIYAGKCSQ